MPSDQSGAPTRLETVAAWRVQLLDRVFTYMFVLLSAILALEALASLRSRHWHALPSLAVAVALQGVAAFARRLNPRWRAGIFTAAAWVGIGTAMPTLGFAFPIPFVVASLTFTLLVLCVGARFALVSLLVLVVILIIDAYYVCYVRAPPFGEALAQADGILDPRRLANWIRVTSGFAAVAVAIIASVAFLVRRLETAVQHNGLLFGMLVGAREEERKFIAHELHDELGQTLTALKLRMQVAARESGVPPAGPVLELIEQLIAQVRKMSGDLRPPLLDEMGLVPALRAYLHNQLALIAVAIDLDVSEPNPATRLAPELEIACFRVIQEALTNALRHAAPSRIQIGVRRDEGQIAISVRDDGRGFDTRSLFEKASKGHLGVVGMRERVLARGGTFDLVSRPGAGTTIEARFPIVLAGQR